MEGRQPPVTERDRDLETPHEPAITEGSFDASIPDADQRLGDRRVDEQPTGLKKFFAVLGPGLITGASDDDPSGVGTYATTGASTGYRYLWTALITYPLMAAIQGMCARIGLVSKVTSIGAEARQLADRVTAARANGRNGRRMHGASSAPSDS